MLRAISSRYRGGHRSTSVANFSLVSFKFSKVSAESRLNERPSSSVLSFFLTPGDGGVLILLGAGSEGAEGERRHLLDTDDGDIVNASLHAFSF